MTFWDSLPDCRRDVSGHLFYCVHRGFETDCVISLDYRQILATSFFHLPLDSRIVALLHLLSEDDDIPMKRIWAGSSPSETWSLAMQPRRTSSTFSSSMFSLSALGSLLSSSASLGSETYRSGDLYFQSLNCNHVKLSEQHVSYLRLSTDSRPTKLELATTPCKWRHFKALRRIGRRCLLCSIIAQGVISFLGMLSIENQQRFCEGGTCVIKFIYSAETGVLFTAPVSTTHALSFSLFATEGLPSPSPLTLCIYPRHMLTF